MVRVLREIDKSFEKDFDILLKKRGISDSSIEKIVDKIISDVKKKRW